ncbi:phosphopantetheine-binding protein [Micromonospora lutea]|uniref:Carrier domain-containing protein n=1 Tax=Micromonospora lutea TaxID=419825 RepID=A0ABQ4ISZ7_9ACTN|nr:phosphopantetheine-binding protein [Micromonospora lutea]GIJ21046.1 hypothetical protein Vlu01_16700 [Micromonospora lutea]
MRPHVASDRVSPRWSPEFEQTLREHLPDLDEGVELADDDALFDLGLDSFGTVDLMVTLEGRLGVSIPDDKLTAETFATVGSLWGVLGPLLHGAPSAVPPD